MRIKLDRRQRFAKSQAGNIPPIVAGAKKRAAQVSAGKLKGGHEGDVAEARSRLEEAEELVRDDDVIRVDLAATRRNVLTRGIDVNALVGRTFRIGDVLCRGRRLCEPCAHLDRLAGPGLLRPLIHRGGLRADVLTDGEIRLGAPVRPA